MVINDGARLRQLVGDYYHGLISPESYREQRGQLLDNIGAPADEQSDTISSRQPPSVAEKFPAANSAPLSPESPASASGSRKGVIIAAAVVGLVVVGFVVATQVFEFDPSPGSSAEQEALVPQSGLARGDALIDEFLSRNDWSDDSLSNFSLAWGALNDDQRQLGFEGRRFRVFATMLHRRIREETALGNAPGHGRLDSLTEFAVTMGAPYRGSVAPVTDKVRQEETVVSVDSQEKPPVPETAVENAVTSQIEDLEEEPAPVAADSPPAEEAEPLIERAEPAVDEGDQPVDAGVPAAAPVPSVSTDLGAAVDDPCPAEIANTRRPYCQDVLSDGGKGPALVVLPTGSFEMGNDGVDSESPAHQVEIAHVIAMSRFEITSDEYTAFCAATSLLCADPPWGGDRPVVSVTWDDAVSYTEWLSESTGFGYRLPSEAEWEFAARAGTRSPYFFGDEITPAAALSSENGPVEAPLPRSDRSINRNPFRLHHMSGNVREWTLDAWYPNYEHARPNGSARLLETESLRVVRGGSYSDTGSKLRSAAREPLDRSHRDTMTGFRVVREVHSTRP